MPPVRRKKAPIAAKKRLPASASLLVEILTEELPPKSLARLAQAFAQGVFQGLKERNFVAAESDEAQLRLFATPRRLAVLLPEVADKQTDRTVERRGPAVAAGVDAAGKPTPALLGFAKSCGVDASKLERQKGDKGEYFVHRIRQKGETLQQHLAAVVESSLQKLPAPKLMRWGAGEAQFVRPIHGVILLHGNKPVPGRVLGIKAGNTTHGHRFLSQGRITVARADDYEKILQNKGKVVAGLEPRRGRMAKELRQAAAKLKAYVFLPEDWGMDEKSGDAALTERMLTAQSILHDNAELLDEVTALVEWPAVYTGEFDRAFLAVPPQCISLTMQKNQRYFALFSKQGELLPKYLIVSNIQTHSPANIVQGNARVLRARLADAKFFFEQDQKMRLAERVPKLTNVVYHNKLGSQFERMQRIQRLAVAVAERLALKPEDVKHVERAAYLAKADLLTDMVGEFPELQGVMGYYYALHDQEPPAVANAILTHYAPRFSGDILPKSPVNLCVALADKLDILVGIYGIGLVPTGDKDPYGLRRQALGTARILVERTLPLDLVELLKLSQVKFPSKLIADAVVGELHTFILDRLKPYLREHGYQPDEIDAVLSLAPTRLDHLLARLRALRAFRALPEAEALAAANKRIRNILRQAGEVPANDIDAGLLAEDAERQLAQALEAAQAQIEPLLQAADYAAALKRLAALRAAVDVFFDKVMVMTENPAQRNNRLALLNRLANLFLRVADISRLQISRPG